MGVAVEYSGPIIAVAAVTVAVTAAMIDIRQRRIPNRLTYPMMVFGLGAQSMLYGWKGLLSAGLGGLVFGGVFFVFYLVRAMGAGDVKLAAALGCIVGLVPSLQVMFATAMAGGVLAIVHVIFSGRLLATLRNTFTVVVFHARFGLRGHPVVNLDNPAAARMPYGLAFAVGTLYWAAPALLGR